MNDDPEKMIEDEAFLDKVEKFIDEEVRPFLQSDGGDIQCISFADGVLRVQLHGACHQCPSSTMTLKYGVELRLREQFPEIQSLELAGMMNFPIADSDCDEPSA